MTKATLVFLLITLVSGSAQAQQAPLPEPPQPETEVSPPEYPRSVETDHGRVIVHMPQVDAWQDYQTLTGWVALEAKLAGEEINWIGSVKFSGQTDIDFDRRLVVIHDIEIIESKVVGAESAPENIKNLVHEALPMKPRAVPLDVVLRALPVDFDPPNYRPGPAATFKSDPPRIFSSTSPAALMIIDGDAVKAPIDESTIQFVVNTNWDLFWDTKKERWYALNGNAWQYTRSLSEPKWKTTTRLPKDLKNIPDEPNWAEVRKALPAKKPKQDPPEILVSFVPAELILIEGEPELETVVEAGVTYVSNTEADLFVDQGEYYYLVSGRWFHSQSLSDGWAPVEQIPENFRHIPEDHEKGHVLASIPGTDDARAAAIEAQIPRTATINVDATPEIEVVYAGEPQFVAIEGTDLQRAANTNFQVIKAGEDYYLCYNAIWFKAADAEGPWAVATEVPEAIYAIPASDPAHNVTYVYSYPQSTTTTTSSTSVTYAYSPGYVGTYMVAGAVVFGTGFYYRPYYYYYPWGYPAYWHYPRAYGHGAWYNPATGTYGRASAVYGPYGGAGAAAAYNPRTGTYARGWSAWDNDELVRSGGAYNPRTGTWGAGNMYYDFDNKEGWSDRFVQKGDRWFHSETEYQGNRARGEYETARGITGVSERVRDGDVITGSGTISGGNREGTTSSRIDRDGANLGIDGSQGGSVDVSKTWGDEGRDTTVTRPGGESITGNTSRTDRGARTDFETSGGGTGTSLRTDEGRTTLGRSNSGDLYAARNGEVYRRGSEGGWSQYNNGGWSQSSRSSTNRNYSRLDRQQRARQSGSRNYSQYRSQYSGARRGSMSGRRGGGGRRR